MLNEQGAEVLAFSSAHELHERTALRTLMHLTDVASRTRDVSIILDEALQALEQTLKPDRSSVLVMDAGGVMRFRAWRGLSDAYRRTVEGHSPWTPDAIDPLPFLIPDVTSAPELARYGDLFEKEGIASLAFIPITAAGKLLGKFMLYYGHPHPFATREIDLARAIAGQIGFVLERKSAAENHDIERAQRRLSLLAEAGQALNQSLDYAQTLTNLAHLVVPGFADWCIVDVVQPDGSLKRIAGVAAQMDKQALLDRLLQDYPPTAHSNQPAARALRQRAPVLLEALSDEALRASCYDGAHFELMKGLEPHSAMALPLIARGKLMGALTFAWAESGKRYDAQDVACAQELAARAALALENAGLYRELAEAVRARDEFLAIASHELKTPLTSLFLQLASAQSQAQLASAPTAATRQLEKLHMMERQVRRLASLVDELLSVSRITSGKLQLLPEELDLTALTLDIVKRFEADAAHAGCSLTVRAPEPVRGSWDRLRVEQILSNLLSNALKYGDGKPVEVRVEGEPLWARIVIRDSGLGIPPDDQARIFDRFERLVSSKHFSGFGLGLWIVRKIVEAHRGKIHLRSAPGQGSTFTIELPR